ncbi:MAG: hypothetical protein JST01_01865 [Cyanobacteria bacterium SZAS TMP-1]|nr:hypothetical protein [Cyanobacteria bacterium SZAS TMP-1]
MSQKEDRVKEIMFKPIFRRVFLLLFSVLSFGFVFFYLLMEKPPQNLNVSIMYEPISVTFYALANHERTHLRAFSVYEVSPQTNKAYEIWSVKLNRESHANEVIEKIVYGQVPAGWTEVTAPKTMNADFKHELKLSTSTGTFTLAIPLQTSPRGGGCRMRR